MAPANERREGYTDIEHTLGRLSAAIESLEKLMDFKFEALEEKLDNRLAGLEKKMDDQCKTSKESELKIAQLAELERKVTAMHTSISILSAQVDELKQNPQRTKAALIDDLITTVKNGLITLIAGSVIGFIVWVVSKYLLR